MVLRDQNLEHHVGLLINLLSQLVMRFTKITDLPRQLEPVT